MAASMIIDAVEALLDDVLLDYFVSQNKRARRIANRYGGEINTPVIAREILRTKQLKKSTVERLTTEYVEAKQVVWTLNGSNHTDVCLSLEGKRWSTSEAHPEPGIHWNCKSELLPYYPQSHQLHEVFNG